MNIDWIENPIKYFSVFLNAAESFINDVVCVEDKSKRLTQTVEDFVLFDDAICLADYDQDPFPEDVRRSIYRGVMFLFSEILTKDFGLKWGLVIGGPEAGEALVIPGSSVVINLENMIHDYINETGEISFQDIYKKIESLLKSGANA